eukprot:CAMPEP_0119034140 /NCGR_PEP_ID=MMETSP1177-20130426/1169_1 /TAXON_ID=2985 /ORGANISM="Ochromonas sp, Strain CCMP1899" /LENGTH=281 /DNA_ID=CAMNT_0006991385 /DNA_START=187 /DNA_END=1032 /DNA_ORIENTATION=+
MSEAPPSETPPKVEENESSADMFATPPPLSTLSESGELEIDFDSLASESAKSAFTPKSDISSMYVKDPSVRVAPRQAQWFPMLLSPTSLDGSMAGDVGFDPLGFSKSPENAIYMREAEIKHCRLAMLAAAGWPLSELWHKGIASTIGLDSILSADDKAPSVLNGGLSNEWIIGTGVFSLILGAILEFKGMELRQKDGYKVGDYGFDPLGLYPFRASFGIDRIDEKLTREEKIVRAKFDMELAEVKNGRMAMLAITAYAAQEFLSGMPVVQQTPFFFGDPIN